MEEQRSVSRSAGGSRQRIVNLIWSAKESALKALHEGLRLDTRDVIVTLSGSPAELSDNRWHALRVRYREGQAFEGWWAAAAGWLRTLVVAPAAGPPVFLRGPAAGPAG